MLAGGDNWSDSCRPLFVQFCANDPETLLKAAKLVEGQCDAVDINFGCPQRIARRGKYGAFLMDDLPLVEKLVRTLAEGLSIPVTCKVMLFPAQSTCREQATFCFQLPTWRPTV